MQSGYVNQRGTAALELGLLMPLLVAMFFGIIQFGSILFIQTNMETAARETVRLLAIGDITLVDADSVAQGKLDGWPGMTFTVNATQPSGTDVSVEITIPLSEASIVDVLGLFETGLLRSAVTMRIQN